MLASTSSRALLRNLSAKPSAVRAFTSVSPLRSDAGPKHDSRISPGTAARDGTHPGYTSADTPVTSAHPSSMPGPSSSAKPSSTQPPNNTSSAPPHPATEKMLKGGQTEGSDAVTPEERVSKVWGPNARSSQFNEAEGKRNPIREAAQNDPNDPKANTNSPSSAPKKPSSRRRFSPSSSAADAPMPSLEDFVLRGQLLGLYRTMIRGTRNIPNPDARRETVAWFREDFDRLGKRASTEQLKAQLLLGHVTLKRMQGGLDLVAEQAPKFGTYTPYRGGRGK